MTDLFPVDPIEFSLPAPDSKKNRGAVIKIAGHYSITPNPVAKEQQRRLRDHLFLALGAHPHFGDHDVRVEVDYVPREDEVLVRVSDIRERPRGFTGRKRDLANLLEVILDAMQGPVYHDDNQVAEIAMQRILRGIT